MTLEEIQRAGEWASELERLQRILLANPHGVSIQLQDKGGQVHTVSSIGTLWVKPAVLRVIQGRARYIRRKLGEMGVQGVPEVGESEPISELDI